MSVHQPVAELREQAIVVPAFRGNRGTRVFDVHPAIHLTLLGAYLTFAAVLMTAFMGNDLKVPAAIVVIGILSLFITPAWWSRVAPDDGARKQNWGEFMNEGVECITGKLTAGQALAQIMVLPGLMVGLALVFATIKATL
jgi:Flp pilus assembly protein TadB